VGVIRDAGGRRFERLDFSIEPDQSRHVWSLLAFREEVGMMDSLGAPASCRRRAEGEWRRNRGAGSAIVWWQGVLKGCQRHATGVFEETGELGCGSRCPAVSYGFPLLPGLLGWEAALSRTRASPFAVLYRPFGPGLRANADLAPMPYWAFADLEIHATTS
jgi:hypothetical protein